MRVNPSVKKVMLARQMLLSGYVTKIISIETGFSYKQIRRHLAELRAEGYKIKPQGRSITSSYVVVSNHIELCQASMLMQIYSTLGGPSVMESVNISALDEAYRMYMGLCRELPGNGRINFSISQAWCLASELRGEIACMKWCADCQCYYFTSFKQRTGIICPFCILERKMDAPETEGKDEARPAIRLGAAIEHL